MHNTRYVVLAACALATLPIAAYSDAFARSFLATHTPFDTLSPECISMFRADRMDKREDGHGGGGQLAVFGGQTSLPSSIAEYFLPNGKNTIIVGEDNSISARTNTRDVNAAYFDIVTDDITAPSVYNYGFTRLTFESTVRFCPKQTLSGIGFAWQQRLPRRFWFDITIPVVRVKNRLCMQETISDKGGPRQAWTWQNLTWFNSFITGANYNDNGRLYGNMTNKCLKRTRVSHIDIRVGRDFEYNTDWCTFGGFLGLLIPCGNKPCATWLFEPMVGSRHVGLEMGTYSSFELLNDPNVHTLTAYFSGLTRYLLPNNQKRSFDLRGKPWSRYMWVWTDNNNNRAFTSTTQALTEQSNYLINYSTLCVRVHPHYSYEVNSGLNYKNKGFTGEFGFNFYGQKAEEICFTRAMDNGTGLPAVYYYLTNQDHAPATNSLAIISSPLFKGGQLNNQVDEVVNPTSVNDTAAYNALSINDLDPLSGAQPAVISQVIYGALGYQWDNIKFPLVVSGGASYEFSKTNAATTRWIAWLKVGVSI